MDSIIYNLISKEKLSELVTAFYSCIELPIQILDVGGKIIEARGKKAAYCSHFCSFISDLDACKDIHLSAAHRALEIGEAYIFSCHSNLTHIAFPLVSKNVLYGSVLIGPFLMEEPSSSLVLEVGKKYPALTNQNLMQLYDDSADIDLVEPSKVTQISKLLYFLFSGLITESRERFVINQQKVHQQSLISESIQLYKTGTHSDSPQYPYLKEQQLLTKVKEGNVEESKRILNELLGYLLLNAKNDVDIFRNRSLELCAILSRIAIGNGASQKEVFQINDHFLTQLKKCNSIEDICYGLQETLSSYISCMFPVSQNSGSRQVREAMNFISANFHENISLSDVASQVCLNETYLSRLFHQATGLTFKDYLTNVRIEEAKRLLKNTEYPLLEIAIAIGYNDQSYFSRVFKSITGMSPSEYRLS